MAGRMAEGAGRIGLALGSGGARGWSHIGVIRALEELGIDIAAVAGCSMGAVVGAAHAGGRLDALEDWARSLTATGVLRYIDMRLFRGGLVEGQQVMRLLKTLELPGDIADLAMPFGTVATDLATGAEIWFRDGDLATAVRASLSVPGVFSPYPHGEKWLLDGALVDPVPVALARALGAETVIAVDPNATAGRPLWSPEARNEASQTILARIAQLEVLPRALRGMLGPADAEAAQATRPPNYFDVVGTAIDIMQVAILRARLAEDPPAALIETDLKGIGILELHRADEAIAEGYDRTMAQADALRALAGPVRPARPPAPPVG